MINQHPQRSDEPVWWGLFGAGGTWFAMITPVTVLILGILAPLGVLDADALSYERVAGFAGSFIGGIIVILSLAMPMWHGMHRLYHGMHDMKIHVGPILKFLCYAIAFAITVLAVAFVFMV